LFENKNIPPRIVAAAPINSPIGPNAEIILVAIGIITDPILLSRGVNLVNRGVNLVKNPENTPRRGSKIWEILVKRGLKKFNPPFGNLPPILPKISGIFIPPILPRIFPEPPFPKIVSKIFPLRILAGGRLIPILPSTL